MAPRKVDFALAVRDAVTSLAEAAERIAELDDIFTASGYDAGGIDPIVDADIAAHDITASDLAKASIFASNLTAFLNNGIPLQYDYATDINAFRGMTIIPTTQVQI